MGILSFLESENTLVSNFQNSCIADLTLFVDRIAYFFRILHSQYSFAAIVNLIKRIADT